MTQPLATSSMPSSPYDAQPIIQEIKAWKNEIRQRHLDFKEGFPAFGTILEEFEQFCIEYLTSSDQNDLETVNAILFEYWEPLRYAIMQHRSETYRRLLTTGYTKIKEYNNALAQKLNIQVPSEQDARTVLYFEKTGKAKRYPFRGVNLIGSPLADAYQDRWLSIPHEMGHLLYWNARFNRFDKSLTPQPGENFFEQEIEASLQPLNQEKEKAIVRKLLADWNEEIFADIIGARIAGEAFAGSAWKRVTALNKTQASLFRNDQEHPIPLVTPYISHFVAFPGTSFDEQKWAEYGLRPDDLAKTNPENELSARKLIDCTKIFVEKVNAQVPALTLDPWYPTTSTSPFKALLDFIKKTVTYADPAALQIALLQPRILEKGINWKCWHCGFDQNPSTTIYCARCGWPTGPWF